jgi:hypothetical protein
MLNLEMHDNAIRKPGQGQELQACHHALPEEQVADGEYERSCQLFSKILHVSYEKHLAG